MRYWKAAWLVVAMSAASGAQANLETEPWLESPWLEHPWLDRGSAQDEQKAPCSFGGGWNFDLPPCPPSISADQEQRDQFGNLSGSFSTVRPERKEVEKPPPVQIR